jgi:rRNA maturation endonuclease Nob1
MNYCKKLCALFAATMFLMQVSYSQSVQKQNIRVLYVGYDPTMPIPDSLQNKIGVTGGAAPERFVKEYKSRMPAFQIFLETYFSVVKTVDARKYTMEMSKDYDVTIFDQAINPWKERVYEKRGGRSIFEPAKYLTEDFDRAAIFIGHIAPTMGESVGSKLDWHCLCLDADAHNIETKHPIFNQPFKVKLTYTNKPTPKNYHLFPSGQNLTEQMPMWRVQKEGYKDEKGYRVGLVSRRAGFTDSPEAEFIAGGVNTKDAEAVAIGRHGNFFLWGFSGSPDYMTDEARLVFANAVVYMKTFNGQKIIARKYQQTIPVRDEMVNDMLYRITKEAYQHYLKYEEEANKSMADAIAKVKKKKEDGITLSESESAFLNAKASIKESTTWAKYFRMMTSQFFKDEYVENPGALKEFLVKNREYMYCDPAAQYSLKIDEDAQVVSISNRDIKLLYKAVELMQKGEQVEMANRILSRYTREKFSTANEWKQWLDANRKKLFFTDAGGYVWLVNNVNNTGDHAKN